MRYLTKIELFFTFSPTKVKICFMIRRKFWLDRIKKCWESVPIVWLSGVRRVGKTTLVQEIENALYLNCDLPSVKRLLEDPEFFFESVTKPIVIFDEIHQLADPSALLKIGADAYGHLKIIATGSSTLAATQKFSDSLTGRKRSVHLVPILSTELNDFGIKDITQRLLRGGLPPALLSEEFDFEFYSEWIDSFFSRDIQELFNIEKRAGFLRLLEYLIKENGGLIEFNTLSKYAGLSIPTVNNYLQMLETTHAVYCLRPFHGGGKREMLKQPKYYAFDTGFVSYYNGWQNLRNEDCGLLLENLVLETLQSLPFIDKIYFWRDKEKREIDFVCPRRDGSIDTIECKWNAECFNTKTLAIFRESYPKGNNFVVSSQVSTSYRKRFGEREVTFTSIYELGKRISL